MKKLEIKKSFKNNKFKYGGYATLLTSIVLIILLVANLVVDQMDFKFDMTKNKLYSLSDQSYKVMDKLTQDINIISFYKAGNENQGIVQILNKYHDHNKKVTLKYVDPITNPQISKKYSKDGSSVAEGNIVVESGSKFKVINEADLYNTTQDQTTGQTSVQSLAVEQKITGAIMYVVNSKNSVVYMLQGHNEQALAPEVMADLNNQNFQLKPLNLLTGDWKPQVGDMLLVSSSATDLSSDELTKLKDYFSKGGHGVFLMDLTKTDLPNFKTLMSTFGIEIQRAIALEGDAQHSLQQKPLFVVPNMDSHDIVNPMISAKIPVLFPYGQPIQQLKIKKSSLKIEPLLTTTDKSWGKINMSSQSIEKEAGDIAGPFDIAVAITDNQDSSKPENNAKVVVFSSTAFISSQFSSATAGNLNLFMNSMNWVQDLKGNIAISPKDVTSEPLKITSSQALGYSGFVIIVIPAIVLIAGVIVWLRRRHL
ncbi:GldG family protein [Clostridium estertheticum]|uniref:GldG family protein n=1 Tax=Clostridium estertheticum TaxID=238834 RepID=UPI0013E90152|nr:Gldg family protein [Clostridium estertheticum]MBZ9685961.1 GldG family protein [Clostridium estertheticum]